MSAARRRYRALWPHRYAAVAACYHALVRADPQFPEAACPLASRLLCEILPQCMLMTGSYQDSKMPTRCMHIWVFDMRAGVHIDLTSGQFPGGTKGVAVYATGEAMCAYSLGSLGSFNEAMSMNYIKGPMSDIVVGTTTLARVALDARSLCRYRPKG